MDIEREVGRGVSEKFERDAFDIGYLAQWLILWIKFINCLTGTINSAFVSKLPPPSLSLLLNLASFEL
ncbi:hypothetical protein M407DRAFT_244221 [Tulasnella calospora MUT 4182]|uniref:Uncharacterized protein n=1 Tax=Tulasnella calospora MUT 4182 TaxID=1051891 RepID=A0A0C3LUK5_9AGAM|nr:hypothetical protein M407DRAFT_244221 [Tulasnella calospora MUT 4182]